MYENRQQSSCIEEGNRHTTDTIRLAVVFTNTTYDTTQLYASFVLQVSSNFNQTESDLVPTQEQD